MGQRLWLTGEEDRAWRAYRRMKVLLDAQLARDLVDGSGLSEPDYDVLSNLSEIEGERWRITELAARMQWSKSRLSHHLDRMEQRGLVRREECRTDGRGAFVVLTAGGRRAIEQAAPGHVASVREHFIDQLTARERECLTTIAEKVMRHLGEPLPLSQR